MSTPSPMTGGRPLPTAWLTAVATALYQRPELANIGIGGTVILALVSS